MPVRLLMAAVFSLFLAASFVAAPPASAATTCPYDSTQGSCSCPTTGPGVSCIGGQLYSSTSSSCYNDPRTCNTNEWLNCDSGSCECNTVDFPCGGCTGPTSTIGASCSSPTGGAYADQCGACSCPTGTALCSSSNVCVTVPLCQPGTTFDPCLNECVTPYVLVSPSATQTANVDVSGNVKMGGDIYMATGKAIRVDGSGTTNLVFGNWGSGAAGLLVTVNGNLNATGGLCLSGDCITSWADVNPTITGTPYKVASFNGAGVLGPSANINVNASGNRLGVGTVASDSYGIRATGNVVGGYFENSSGSGKAYVASSEEGIYATGNVTAGRFANSNGGAEVQIGGTNYAFSAGTPSVSYGYLRTGLGVGYPAQGLPTALYVSDLWSDNTWSYGIWSNLSGTGTTGVYGKAKTYGVRGEGESAGGYFADTTSGQTGKAWLGIYNSGIQAEGSVIAGEFYNTGTSGSRAYIGGSYAVDAQGGSIAVNAANAPEGVHSTGTTRGGYFSYSTGANQAFLGESGYAVRTNGDVYVTGGTIGSGVTPNQYYAVRGSASYGAEFKSTSNSSTFAYLATSSGRALHGWGSTTGATIYNDAGANAAIATSGAGIVATGTTDSAGRFYNSNSGNRVDLANSNYGVYVSGSPSYGVYGTGTGYGVYGNDSNSAGYGYLGYGNYGVYGYGGYGVYGNGTSYGVYGTGSTYGVYGYGPTGVYAYGTSTGANIRGGSYGVSTTGTSYGVYATSSGTGVYGYSSSSSGVYGSGPYGVYGYSSSGTAIYGYSSSGYGGYFNGNVYVSKDVLAYNNVWGTTSTVSCNSGYYQCFCPNGSFVRGIYWYNTYVRYLYCAEI